MYLRRRREAALGRPRRRTRTAAWASEGGSKDPWSDLAVAERYVAAFLCASPASCDKSDRPALVALSGLPGTGKSHFARALAPRIGGHIVSSDRVRKLLYARPTYDDAEHAVVHGVCQRLVARGLREGRCVILDATNLSEASRRRYRDMAGALGARFQLVAIRADESTIRARLLRRALGEAEDGSDATQRAYDLLRRQVEPVVGPHLVIRGEGDIGRALAIVVAALQGVPEQPRATRAPFAIPLAASAG